MNPQRTKYDSVIPWLYHHGKEHLIPDDFRKTIPYSTISSWRNQNLKPYYGTEFRNIQKESLDWYELFQERNHLKKTVRVLAKTWISVSNILAPIIQKSKQHSELFMNAIQQLKTVFPIQTACHIAGISKSAFDYRIAQIKYTCDLSPLSMCFKRHPLQLTFNETETIRSAFLDPGFSCWPAVSIYYKLLRDKTLSISLSTFYKYVRILGLKRSWTKAHKKTKGIESSHPNQYLHVDTTYWELKSGVKAAIVFVSDNFSRAILGCEVALENRAENVKTALQKAILTIHQLHPEYICPAILVADGGSENHAKTINQLLQVSISKSFQL